MPEQITISFTGENSSAARDEVTGEPKPFALGWGQSQIWKAMRETNSSMGMGAVVPTPPGRTAEDYAAELKFFLSRYEAMRTRLRIADDGSVTQVVAASGEATMEVIDAGDDAAGAAEALLKQWQDNNFDYEREWPVRVAVVRAHGAVVFVVVMICHIAVDGVGAGVMMRELGERDPVTGAAAAAHAAMPPSELVAWQASPAAERQTGAAMRYWETQLRSIPARRFEPSGDVSVDRYQQICWTSAAMRLAAQSVSAKLGVDSSPVFLAAFAVGLVRLTGNNPFVASAIVNNRFRPGLAEIVSPLNQNGLCVVDVAEVSLAEAIDRARRSSMTGSKYAYYDPRAREELIARLGQERGEPIDLACFYNDRGRPDMEPVENVTPQDIEALLPQSAVLWEKPMKTFNEKLMVNIDDTGEAVQITAEVDTEFFSLANLRALMWQMESVVTEAAADPGASTKVRSPQAVP
jgi:hypothetical protein